MRIFVSKRYAISQISRYQNRRETNVYQELKIPKIFHLDFYNILKMINYIPKQFELQTTDINISAASIFHNASQRKLLAWPQLVNFHLTANTTFNFMTG